MIIVTERPTSALVLIHRSANLELHQLQAVADHLTVGEIMGKLQLDKAHLVIPSRPSVPQITLNLSMANFCS